MKKTGLVHVMMAMFSLIKDVDFQSICLLHCYQDNKYMKYLVAVSDEVKLSRVPPLRNVGSEKYRRHNEKGHVTHMMKETLVMNPVYKKQIKPV